MSCDLVRKQLGLFVYGELSFDEEELVEQHLESCPACRHGLEREKKLHELLDRQAVEPAPELLARCRRDLGFKVACGAGEARGLGFVARMREAVRVLMGPPARFMPGPAYLRPVAAVALVALGFFSARLTAPKVYAPAGLGPSGSVASRIRYIQPDASGRVEIVLDETRQRVVTGRLDDEPILRMLLAAAKDPSDPGLRGESVELLKDHAASSEVRSALLEALRRDPNAGVRLQAMEGLRSFSREPASRKALIEALLSDVNPGVRTQAIDLLMQQRDAAMAPAFQESLRREDNNYVRLRVQNALREMNASMETF